MILRVGVTGGIASGKTLVIRRMEELGCVVVDADAIVRELYRPGGKGHAALLRIYGPVILTIGGEIDRGVVSDLALATPEGAMELNALIHPLVHERVAKFFQALEQRGSDLIGVVEATLMVESGSARMYDRIVVVDADVNQQLERAVARGLTREEAKRRVARQLGSSARTRFADYVIDSRGTIGSTLAATDAVVASLQRDLVARRHGMEPSRPSQS